MGGSSRPRATGAGVCGTGDLVPQKVLSDRPKDLEDARAVLRVAGSGVDRARLGSLLRTLAADLDRPAIAARWESLVPPKAP